jgi:hypothetical protein
MVTEEDVRRIVREEIAAAVPREVEVQLVASSPAIVKAIGAAVEVRMRSQRIVDLIFERRRRHLG